MASRSASAWLCAAACTVALAAPAGAQAAGYGNPFADATTVTVGRTDMGVDVCLAPGDPIKAIGDGVVAGVMPNWYAGQPYVWYELTSGSQAGRYVYVAEQIKLTVKTGDTLHAGEVIARYAKAGSCIETGWAAASGATAAQVNTGYHEGEVTPAGVSFARFLRSLGVTGNFELSSPRPVKDPKPAQVSPAPAPTPIATTVTPPASAGATTVSPPTPTATAPAPTVSHPSRPSRPVIKRPPQRVPAHRAPTPSPAPQTVTIPLHNAPPAQSDTSNWWLKALASR